MSHHQHILPRQDGNSAPTSANPLDPSLDRELFGTPLTAGVENSFFGSPWATNAPTAALNSNAFALNGYQQAGYPPATPATAGILGNGMGYNLGATAANGSIAQALPPASINQGHSTTNGHVPQQPSLAPKPRRIYATAGPDKLPETKQRVATPVVTAPATTAPPETVPTPTTDGHHPPPKAPKNMLQLIRPSERARPAIKEINDLFVTARLVRSSVVLYRIDRSDQAKAIAQYAVDLMGQGQYNEWLTEFMDHPLVCMFPLS
jgi:hypothetical protein